MGFAGGAVVKNLPADARGTRDADLIPGSGRSCGVGNGNPRQYSCLANSVDRGAWWATKPMGPQRIGLNWANTRAQIEGSPCHMYAFNCSIVSGFAFSWTGFSVHGDSPGKNTGVGCYAFLQRIFPTQGLNPGLPHCRRILMYNPCLTLWKKRRKLRRKLITKNRYMLSSILYAHMSSWAHRAEK